jgi:hypothetical protein
MPVGALLGCLDGAASQEVRGNVDKQLLCDRWRRCENDELTEAVLVQPDGVGKARPSVVCSRKDTLNNPTVLGNLVVELLYERSSLFRRDH